MKSKKGEQNEIFQLSSDTENYQKGVLSSSEIQNANLDKSIDDPSKKSEFLGKDIKEISSQGNTSEIVQKVEIHDSNVQFPLNQIISQESKGFNQNYPDENVSEEKEREYLKSSKQMRGGIIKPEEKKKLMLLKLKQMILMSKIFHHQELILEIHHSSPLQMNKKIKLLKLYNHGGELSKIIKTSKLNQR